MQIDCWRATALVFGNPQVLFVLIVPLPPLGISGRRDLLKPPEGVEKIREKLVPLYRTYGCEQDRRIELFDCAHEDERLIIDWRKKYLAEPAG